MNYMNFVKDNNSPRVSDITNVDKQFDMIRQLVVKTK